MWALPSGVRGHFSTPRDWVDMLVISRGCDRGYDRCVCFFPYCHQICSKLQGASFGH